MTQTPPEPGAATAEVVTLPRISIDFKVPLWSLVTVAFIGASLLLQMWMTLSSVRDSTTEMQATLKRVVETNTQLISDQALIKFRIEKLEAERHNPK